MKRLLLLFITLSLSIAFYGCSSSFISDTDVSKVVSLINQEKVDDALQLYDSKIVQNEKKTEKTADELRRMINDTMKKYYSMEYDYTTALAKLLELERFSCITSECRDAINKLQILDKSSNYYEMGLHYIEQKDFIKAIESLKNVEPISEHYNDATIKINESKQKYKEDVISSCDSLLAAGKYDEALDTLYIAINNFPDDPDYKRVISYTIEGYTDMILIKAQYLYDNGRYKEAVDYLKLYRSLFKSDRIEEAIKNYSKMLPQ